MALHTITATVVSAAPDEAADQGLDLSNITDEIDLNELDDILEEVKDAEELDEADLSPAESALLDFFHAFLLVVPNPDESQLVHLCQAVNIPNEQCLSIIQSLIEIRDEEHAEQVKARVHDVLDHEGTSELLTALEALVDEDDEDDMVEIDLEASLPEDDEGLEADLDDPVLDTLVEASTDGDSPASQPDAIIVDPPIGESEEETLNKALNNDGIPNPDPSPLEPALNNDGDIERR